MPAFLPGLELSRAFHDEIVEPLLARLAPGIPLAVARIGAGSEVLGFDTPRSADHEWGPRLQVFLRPDDVAAHAVRIVDALAEHLPTAFRGFPTHFAPTGEGEIGVMAWVAGPVHHRVEVTDLPAWCRERLGFDPGDGVTVFDWLSTPSQRLAEVTAGAVFRDDLRALQTVRTRLRSYPADVWRHLLAGRWSRVGEEAAFPGRCAEVGDELGSALETARVAGELVRLRLLLHGRYPPYPKWLGSAHAALPDPDAVTSALHAAVTARSWSEREGHLRRAYRTILVEQNALGVADAVDPEPRPYHDRPFLVPAAAEAAAALRSRIADPAVRELPASAAVDLLTDDTTVLTDPTRCRAVVRAVTGARQA